MEVGGIYCPSTFIWNIVLETDAINSRDMEDVHWSKKVAALGTLHRSLPLSNKSKKPNTAVIAVGTWLVFGHLWCLLH